MPRVLYNTPFSRRRPRRKSRKMVMKRRSAYRSRRSTKGTLSRMNAPQFALSPMSQKFSVFPAYRKVTSRFVSNLSAALDTSDYFQYNFRANCAYDPDATGDGTTVAGWSVWQTLYQTYIVLRSRIRVDILGESAITNACFATITKSNDDSIASSFANLATDPNTSLLYINGNTANGAGWTLYNALDCKSWYGVKDLRDNVGNLGATTDSPGRPTSSPFYKVRLATMGGSPVESFYFYVNVTIDYDILFMNPRPTAVIPAPPH